MMWAKVRIEADRGFTIPREVLDGLQLKDGDPVAFEIRDEYLVLRKATETPSEPSDD